MSNLEKLIPILCCPETKESLTRADPDLILEINRSIQEGSAKQRNGELVNSPIEAALVRSDRRYAYPVRNEIPIMLIDESIDLSSIRERKSS